MNHSLNINTTQHGDEAVLSLLGELTIEHSTSIKELLLETLQKADQIRIVFEKVSAADISFLQLLCSAHLECDIIGKKISIDQSAEDVLSDLVEQCGYRQPSGCKERIVSNCLMQKL